MPTHFPGFSAGNAFPPGRMVSQPYASSDSSGRVSEISTLTEITEGESVISESALEHQAIQRNKQLIFPGDTRRFSEINIPPAFALTFTYLDRCEKPYLMIGEPQGWHISFYPGGSDDRVANNFIDQVNNAYERHVSTPSHRRQDYQRPIGGVHAPPWFQDFMVRDFPFSFFHVTLHKNSDHGRTHSVGFYFKSDGQMLGERVKYNRHRDRKMDFTGYVTPGMRERAWELSRLVATKTLPIPDFTNPWPKVVIDDNVAIIRHEVEPLPRPKEARYPAVEPHLFGYSQNKDL